MRILDKANIPLNLTGLGLDQRQATDMVESIRSPHGLALVTGPTGSGKSTTLYACLNLLNEPRHNICTVEDPVEYKFKGMNQVQVKAQVGLTFSSALRAFLRQDPDIIMVGEVRDQETAEICLRAALTGHFVLSTIHTNDALSAVTRLQDMGIEPFLLSCTLRVLEAQRLVRRLCPKCKERYEVDEVLAARHNLIVGETLYRPKGCVAVSPLRLQGPSRRLRDHPHHAPIDAAHPETHPAGPASQGCPGGRHEDALRQRPGQGPRGTDQSRGRPQRHHG